MNGDRLFKTILMELNLDSIKLEDELETTINSDMNINDKTLKIKELLTKIAITEASITKFSSMVSINNNKEIKN
jgi:hypothetical protein